VFKFEAEQKVYDIGEITIGGQPGERPTALIASIFYKGDRNVIDEMTGEFNHESALDCIREIENFTIKTSTPLIIDLVASSEMAMVNYVDFIADHTDLPFVIDGTLESIRIAGARRAV
jgi:tetrahydromethanopterin S-methyltransferase subunit H